MMQGICDFLDPDILWDLREHPNSIFFDFTLDSRSPCQGLLQGLKSGGAYRDSEWEEDLTPPNHPLHTHLPRNRA